MAFRLTGSRAVVSSVTADNTASMRVLKKCGFVSIGPDKQNAPARGGMIAVERFSLSRKLWQAERAQPVRDLSHCPA